MRACRAARVPLVPQGGNTGLVGGGIPRDGAVLLSLRRLTTIEDVDPDSGTVVAGAGATVAAVHQAAAEAGWAYGVDLAARDSATVGGTIATNAGGIHVFRNGMTRDQVQGVEAVLGDGTVVSRLHASRKDNTGYALAQLLAGSEGTLGIVTAARLRLLPRLDRLAVAVLGISSVDVAVRLAGTLRRSLPSLNAVELIAGDALDLVVRHGAVRPIGARHPVYLLVEVADIVDPEPAWSRPSIEPPTSTMPSSRPTARRAPGSGGSGRGSPTPSSARASRTRSTPRSRWGGWPRSPAWSRRRSSGRRPARG